MSQGGVIGRPNVPTFERASGLWRLEELLRARLQGDWPSPPFLPGSGLVDFIYAQAKDNVDGDVFPFVPEYPVGDAGTGNFTVSGATQDVTVENHRLAVDDVVVFVAGAGTLPSPLFANLEMFVVSVVDDDTFRVAFEQAGTPVTFTDVGTPAADRSIFKVPLPGDPSGGFIPEVEVFHFSLSSFPTGLAVDSALTFGEDSDEPGRITAIVVDGPLEFVAGGSFGVTNGRNRLALAVFSRDDIDVGDGRNIIQPGFEFAQEPEATTEFRPWRIVRGLPLEEGYWKRGGDGGRGGASGPDSTGGRGGSGGVAFGGSSAPPWPRSAVGTAGADGQPAPGPPAQAGGGGGGGAPAGSGGLPRGSSGLVPQGGAVILSGGNVTIPLAGEVVATGGGGGSGGTRPIDPRHGGGGGGAGDVTGGAGARVTPRRGRPHGVRCQASAGTSTTRCAPL